MLAGRPCLVFRATETMCKNKVEEQYMYARRQFDERKQQKKKLFSQNIDCKILKRARALRYVKKRNWSFSAPIVFFSSFENKCKRKLQREFRALFPRGFFYEWKLTLVYIWHSRLRERRYIYIARYKYTRYHSFACGYHQCLSKRLPARTRRKLMRARLPYHAEQTLRSRGVTRGVIKRDARVYLLLNMNYCYI